MHLILKSIEMLLIFIAYYKKLAFFINVRTAFMRPSINGFVQILRTTYIIDSKWFLTSFPNKLWKMNELISFSTSNDLLNLNIITGDAVKYDWIVT